jgi:pectin methylesterase-like acyl-CoA thioesterase
MTDSTPAFLTISCGDVDLRFTEIRGTLVFNAADIAKWASATGHKGWLVTHSFRHIESKTTYGVVAVDGALAAISYASKLPPGERELKRTQFAEIEKQCRLMLAARRASDAA